LCPCHHVAGVMAPRAGVVPGEETGKPVSTCEYEELCSLLLAGASGSDHVVVDVAAHSATVDRALVAVGGPPGVSNESALKVLLAMADAAAKNEHARRLLDRENVVRILSYYCNDKLLRIPKFRSLAVAILHALPDRRVVDMLKACNNLVGEIHAQPPAPGGSADRRKWDTLIKRLGTNPHIADHVYTKLASIMYNRSSTADIGDHVLGLHLQSLIKPSVIALHICTSDKPAFALDMANTQMALFKSDSKRMGGFIVETAGCVARIVNLLLDQTTAMAAMTCLVKLLTMGSYEKISVGKMIDGGLCKAARMLERQEIESESSKLPTQALTQALYKSMRIEQYSAFYRTYVSEYKNETIVLKPPSNVEKTPVHSFVEKSRRHFITGGGLDLMLESAFPHDIGRQAPDANTVIDCARILALDGDASAILAGLCARFQSLRDRLLAQDAGSEQPPQDPGQFVRDDAKGRHLKKDRRIKRLDRYISFLRVPRVQWTKRFEELWERCRRESVLMLSGLADPLSLTGSGGSGGSGASSSLMPPLPPPPAIEQQPMAAETAIVHAPPLSVAATAVAPAAATAVVGVGDFRAGMLKRVRPVDDCNKCEVARTDPAARAEYSREGGIGANKDVHQRRACPLLAHGVCLHDLEGIARGVAPSLGRKARRQKIAHFMATEFGVSSPLGDEHAEWKVSRYAPDPTAAAVDPPKLVAVDESGVPNASKRHVKVYAGFQLVDETGPS
jgi:hypothetical protein